MIPIAHLNAWARHAVWPDFRQVEQDLIISRVLCDLFNDEFLASRLAFRGGTAINKLLFGKPLRYSEDIDLVQTVAGPIGPTVDAIRKVLSWLGPCAREQAGHSMHLIFRFAPEVESAARLRALLQRRKNRDLFDLNEGLNQLDLDPDKLVGCFEFYLALEETAISRAEAEQRMLQKLARSLTEDIVPLLPVGVEFSDAIALEAFERIWTSLIVRIKGDSWKSTGQAIQEYRLGRYPSLLNGRN